MTDPETPALSDAKIRGLMQPTVHNADTRLRTLGEALLAEREQNCVLKRETAAREREFLAAKGIIDLKDAENRELVADVAALRGVAHEARDAVKYGCRYYLDPRQERPDFIAMRAEWDEILANPSPGADLLAKHERELTEAYETAYGNAAVAMAEAEAAHAVEVAELRRELEAAGEWANAVSVDPQLLMEVAELQGEIDRLEAANPEPPEEWLKALEERSYD